MAKLANKKQSEIKTRIASVRGAAKNPKTARQEGVDVRDEQALKQRISELDVEAKAWDNWHTNPELTAQIRNEANGETAETMWKRPGAPDASIDSINQSPPAQASETLAGKPSTSINVANGEENVVNSEEITDFGEKIGGARKDVWSGFNEAIAEEIDTQTVPLSKSFPKPDFNKLKDKGVEQDTLAFISLMRNSIKTKPKRKSKVQRWATEVDAVRGVIKQLVAGDISLDEAKNNARIIGREFSEAKDAVEAFSDVAPEKTGGYG